MQSTARKVVDTVWVDEKTPAPKFDTLRGSESCDAAVIGGGIAGLSTAYFLAKAGKKPIVLEAGKIGECGQTCRTTAHLMLWNDDFYSVLEKEFGAEKTALVAQGHMEAISTVEQVAKEEGIECDFMRLDGYLFPYREGQDQRQLLDDELAASQRAGIKDARIVNLGGGPEVGGIRDAILYPNTGEFHPGLYCQGLAEAIVRLGGKVYENTRVMETKGTSVSTAGGNTVTSQNIVMATNTPLHHNLAVHSRQEASRSYVVGLAIDSSKVKAADYWDTGSSELPMYHYVRLVKARGARTEDSVLIVGGEDHPTGAPSDKIGGEYDRLEEWTRKRWPQAGELVYRWSGQVYEPIDKLGIYGQDPGNDFQTEGTYYTITGDSGQGTTGGTLGAKIVSDQILGRHNRYSDLYSPSRLPPLSMHTVESVAQVGSQVARGYANVILPKFSSPQDMSLDTGAILQKGTEKVACYKDGQGTAHTFSAICPHMACELVWNPTEKSFDCPCHGSYFDNHGKLMQGPAKIDLPKIDW